MQNAVLRLDLDGCDLIKYLVKILIERGFSCTTTAEYQIVCVGKEKLCRTAPDCDTELKDTAEGSDKEKTCELPVGDIITVSAKRFRCPAVLFRSCSIGKEASAIHDASFQGIMMCDVDI